MLAFGNFCKYLGDFFVSFKYLYNSLYVLPASFGCLLRAAEKQPTTLRLLKPSKSSKMVNLKETNFQESKTTPRPSTIGENIIIAPKMRNNLDFL